MSKPIAFVTGASVGIGRAVATKLASDGFDLIVLARRKEQLDELANELASQFGCDAHVIAADINDQAAVEVAWDARPSTHEHVSVLVNNAGLALGTQPAHEARWEDWLKMIQTNCIALAHLSYLVLPTMVQANHGHIINMGSIAGNYAYRGGNVYGATKAFVDQFSANLRTDVLGSKVRVTNIVPGLLSDTEFSVVRMHGDSDQAKKVYEGLTALKPEDVAEAVSWVVAMPERVNVNRLELMALSQSAGGLAFKVID